MWPSIAKLLAIARAPVRFRHARGDLDAKKLGLDPAYATLALDGTILKFGTTDAIHGDRYVEIDGAVALVPDRFSARLFETPESELAIQKEFWGRRARLWKNKPCRNCPKSKPRGADWRRI